MLERKSKAIAGLLCLSVLAALYSTVYSQNAPAPYKNCFVYYVDRRSLTERVLNFVGLTNYNIGRSFALLAGVSKYPQIGSPDGDLNEAHIDIEKLVVRLKDYEGFDEIVVLENGDVTYSKLEYFLRTYFPSRLTRFPKSRFLFAYSGHGMQSGSEGKEGLLLRSEATSLNDKDHAISLEALRHSFDPVIDSSYHTLILINSCYSGAFGVRTFGGGGGMYPKKPGAHGITAGGGAERTRADPRVGPGSIFFETIIKGLADGSADVVPAGGDGVITAEELFTFTKPEIQHLTRDAQNPRFTDLSRADRTGGSFFFFNGKRFAEVGERPEWDPGPFKGFGTARKQELARANKHYRERKFREAFEIYNAAATEGDTEALMKVAYMYSYGRGVTADKEKGRNLYQQLAERGDTAAMVAIAQTYDDGLQRNTDEQRQQALSWLEKAAGAGDAVAMVKLGGFYYVGRIGTPNITKAVEWYKKAANAGNSEAMRVLGLIYFEGQKGTSVDIDQALGWFWKAADAGNYLAILKLARIYEEGRGGANTDYSEAMRLFKLAASQGDSKDRAEAMAEVGRLYEEGKGVVKSYPEASQWYQKGVDLGGPHAMAQLGRMYKEGRGVPKDCNKALELFHKASGIGSDLAIFEEGTMYEEGLCVEKNLTEARRLYSIIAGDDGYEPANARLRSMGQSAIPWSEQ